MNYDESLEYIKNNNKPGSVLGLGRIRDLMEKLGNPQNDLKFIHIAGTNGKGSTAVFLSNILRQAGYKTGLFTSPYIEVFNERMQINNRNISDEELADIITYIRPFADTMSEKPTEFEFYTAISLVYFKRNKCDIVVYEVGMGGEFDSTNVINSPEVAVITAIGLDHTRELGDTVEKIAATKSKIIKEGCQAVLYKQSDSVTNVIKERCREVGAFFNESTPELVELQELDVNRQIFTYPEYGKLAIQLVGTYQLENVAVVLKVVQVLKSIGYSISAVNVAEGLEDTVWPGRFEVLLRTPVFIVDGGHNPHGIKATVSSLKAFFADEKIHFVFGVLADKDYSNMIDQIVPLAKEVFCVTPISPRALPADKLAEIISKKGVKATAFENIQQAVDAVMKKAGGNDAVCAIGSLYMVGEVREHIRNNY